MIEILRDSPLLLLFVVAGIGYPLGRLRLGRTSLGVAAVLFVGLAFGALDPAIRLPEIVHQLGLVLFVYTIGLSSGPGFFAALERKGLRDNAFILTMLVAAAALAVVLQRTVGLSPTQTAGLFAGALTNTPALAGVLEYVTLNAPPALRHALLTEPVVGYSIAYPVGVLGTIAAIAAAQRIWAIDYRREASRLEDLGATRVPIVSRTIRVVRPDGTRLPVRDLGRHADWHVLFVRIKHDGQVALIGATSELSDGDLVSVIGHQDDIDRATSHLGVDAGESLELDRSRLDFRRVFVSNPQAVSRRVGDLDLPRRFGALITRVRRGDNDYLATPDMMLEPGDRVRVVALRERMDDVTAFFGDSYRQLSEIDILTFSLGLVVGLLVGLVPVPLPGGGVFRLGIAGGPLLVALLLGYRERTGSLIWTLPYGANLTLRQFGLVLFLAGIGTRAGYEFVSTLFSAGGPLLFVAGVAITCTAATLTLWVGYALIGIPMSLLIGMLAGLQTNPAILTFATEQTDNDLPTVGYTTVYPTAMIAKIILAQFLAAFLT